MPVFEGIADSSSTVALISIVVYISTSPLTSPPDEESVKVKAVT